MKVFRQKKHFYTMKKSRSAVIGTRRLNGLYINPYLRLAWCIFFFVLLVEKLTAQRTIKEVFEISPNPKIELIVDGLNNPWGMTFLPDGSMLITEKQGSLIHFKGGKKIVVEGVPEVITIGQGGLLDIALHPDYAKNRWIYISYSSSEGGGGGNTAVLRAKLQGNKLVNKELIYKASPNSKNAVHWGSRIAFDKNNHIYFSIGDRYGRDVNPQSIKRDGGKIYRLNDDGSIPTDNPFVDVLDAKKAVFSYGHRNPQGMAVHPGTGAIWIHEHGPKGGDEINVIKKGKNYGWPKITYGTNYDGTSITNKTSAEGMEQPFYYWTPSIAPCGMAFVTSNLYPKWQGSLLVGSLKFGYLERLVLTEERVIRREKLFDGIGRLRNLKEAPNGELYIAVEGKGIFKITPF